MEEPIYRLPAYTVTWLVHRSDAKVTSSSLPAHVSCRLRWLAGERWRIDGWAGGAIGGRLGGWAPTRGPCHGFSIPSPQHRTILFTWYREA